MGFRRPLLYVGMTTEDCLVWFDCERGRLKFINPYFQTTSLPYQQSCPFPRLAGEG